MRKPTTLMALGAVLGLVIVAGIWRFYDLGDYPSGIYPGVAGQGLDAVRLLGGEWQLFYDGGREGLFTWLQAGLIGMLGRGVWQVYVGSALVGTVTVAVMYLATSVWFGRMAGLFAALFLATSSWHVTLSRGGWREILVPLFMGLFTWFGGCALRAVRRGDIRLSHGYAAFGGIVFGIGFYAHGLLRILDAVIGGVLLLLTLAALHPKIGFPHFKRYGWQAVTGTAVALVILVPFVVHMVRMPESFFGSAWSVSLFDSGLRESLGYSSPREAMMVSVRASLLSFFVGDGDSNWRHAVAGFPLINPLVAVLYLLGLSWAIRGFWLVGKKIVRGQEVHMGMVYAYIILLLVGMGVPATLRLEGVPNGLTMVGLIFPVYLLAGVAGSVTTYWLRTRFRETLLLGSAYGLVLGMVLVGAVYDGALYFLVARNDAQAHFSYRSDLTEVVEYIREVTRTDRSGQVYLVLDSFSDQTVQFLLEEGGYQQVEPDRVEDVVLQVGDLLVFTQSTLGAADAYQELEGDVVVVEWRLNRFGREVLRVYEVVVEPAVEGVTNERGVDREGFGLDA